MSNELQSMHLFNNKSVNVCYTQLCGNTSSKSNSVAIQLHFYLHFYEYNIHVVSNASTKPTSVNNL